MLSVESIAAPTMYTCETCGSIKTGKKTRTGSFGIPMKWKSKDGSVFCNACWKVSYRLRAVTLPVAEPVGMTWDETRKHLQNVWRQSTQLANACVLTLMKAEPFCKYGDKLAPKPKVYLYPLRASMGLSINSSSAGCVTQAVQKKYNEQRFDLLVKGCIAPPVYRYPYPYPVHNSSWKLREHEGSFYVALPLDGIRVEFRLKSGGRHRQISAMQSLIRGDAKQGELAIYARRVQNDVTTFIKMVMYLPNNVRKSERKNVMTVRSDEKRLVVATLEGREIPINFNEDNLRSHIIGHGIAIKRMAEDYKRNRRFGGDKRLYGQNVKAMCDRQHSRLQNAVHEISATLTKHAEKENVQTVVWSAEDKGYCRFPWFALKKTLTDKLSAVGIGLVDVTEPTEKGGKKRATSKARSSRKAEKHSDPAISHAHV